MRLKNCNHVRSEPDCCTSCTHCFEFFAQRLNGLDNEAITLLFENICGLEDNKTDKKEWAQNIAEVILPEFLGELRDLETDQVLTLTMRSNDD